MGRVSHCAVVERKNAATWINHSIINSCTSISDDISNTGRFLQIKLESTGCESHNFCGHFNRFVTGIPVIDHRGSFVKFVCCEYISSSAVALLSFLVSSSFSDRTVANFTGSTSRGLQVLSQRNAFFSYCHHPFEHATRLSSVWSSCCHW